MPVINFPAWVSNDAFDIPTEYNVPAKKVVYALAACEYARRLHNAGWKWFRAEALDATEETILTDAFPGQYPGPAPTEAQMRAYLENQWHPRQNAAQETRAILRMHAQSFDLTWVDWQGLI